MKRILFLVAALAVCASFAAERQLKVESVKKIKVPDGRVIRLENLGLPLSPKPAPVEFVTVLPDGERIAWGVFRGTIEHYIVGYGEKSGLRIIDVTRFFGPHSYKPTIAPYKNCIYILAGNRGPHLLKHDILSGKTVELRHFKDRCYWLGHAVDKNGRIYWAVQDAPNHIDRLIGLDPTTDKIFVTGKICKDSVQSYAISAAAGDDGILYIPIGMKYADLWMLDPRTGEKRSILTEEELARLKKLKTKLMRVELSDGKVYTRIGKEIFLCTPQGLRPTKKALNVTAWTANARFPSKKFRDDGAKAVRFTGDGLVLETPDKKETLLKIAGLPVVGHELYSVGGVHQGKLYGSGIFGGDVFALDLKTLKSTDFGRIGRAGVQQYDLASTPYGVLFCGYTGGYFDLLDPDKPLKPDVNPKPIGDLIKFNQERPFRLTPQDDTNTRFVTGSMATKNALPGAITRVDLKNNTFTCWKNPIPDQTVFDMVTLPNSNLLFCTSGVDGGTGSKATQTEAAVFLFDPDKGEVVWRDKPVKGPCHAYQGTMNTADGRVLYVARVSSGDYRWVVFDPATRKSKVGGKLPSLSSGRFVFAEKRPVNGKNYFTCQGWFFEFDPAANKVTPLFKDKMLANTGYIHYADEDGFMYFLDECRLMRWKFMK